MPIIIPIEGAGEAPAITTLFLGADCSIDIGAGDDIEALSSIDITATSYLESDSSIDIGAESIFEAGGSISIGDGFELEVMHGIDIVAGDSFLILADIVSERLAGDSLGSYGYMEINAELLVDGDEVLIKSFRYQVPTGKLGSILNIVLADPDVSQVPIGADIKFSLVVKTGGIETRKVLLDNGKMSERAYTISYQGSGRPGTKDEVTFSSLDVLSDKFSLAPRRPVVMFDPYRIRYDTVNPNREQLVRDKDGYMIFPILEPVVGLKMRQILSRAYTGIGGSGFITAGSSGFLGGATWLPFVGSGVTDQQGCGFDAVITNIPDYPVRRADFTLEGGWHSGAQPVVAMFDLIYFVTDGKLFILDIDTALPAGITAHTLSLANHKSITERIEYRPDTDAILFTYQYNGNDPGEDPQRQARDVTLPDDVDEAADIAPGAVGYYKIVTRRKQREYYMTDTPAIVLDTLPLEYTVETQQTIVYYTNTGTPIPIGVRVTHQETTTYRYEGDLKVHHTREVRQAIANPGASFNVHLLNVERETCDISWTEDPTNPGVKLQDRVRTDVSMVCAYSTEETETVIDPVAGSQEFTRLIPVARAAEGGIIDNTWALTGLVPVSSRREVLRNMKGDQYDVEVIEIDHLNNTRKRSYIDPTSSSVSNDPYAAKSRTVLLDDPTITAEIGPRIPQAINMYELPRDRSYELAYKKLARLKNPLMTLPISLPGVDFAVEQGSVVRAQKRTGYTSNYFVTGYSIAGDNLGRAGHRISETLESIELFTP